MHCRSATRQICKISSVPTVASKQLSGLNVALYTPASEMRTPQNGSPSATKRLCDSRRHKQTMPCQKVAANQQPSGLNARLVGYFLKETRLSRTADPCL